MNLRAINALLWGNSVALAWMWGLGLFFSVQMTFMFGIQGLLLFAIPNALGLMIFGFLTQIVANRHSGGQESLAKFFDKFSKPFRLVFYLYQILAISLTVFAITKYLFGSIDFVDAQVAQPLYLALAVFVVLAAGCLLGEEFGIQRIKYGHAFLGLLLIAAVVIILFSLSPSLFSEGISWKSPADGIWKGPSMVGYAVPLIVGANAGQVYAIPRWRTTATPARTATCARPAHARARRSPARRTRA